jgi:hypothetical protein
MKAMQVGAAGDGVLATFEDVLAAPWWKVL